MTIKLKSALLGAALLATTAIPSYAVPTTAVDLELSLLVDVSGSVNGTEFNLQKQGYVDAFNSAGLWSAISQGAIGAIAVNLIYWSSGSQQQTAVGWTLIDSAAAAQAFAADVLATGRPFSDLTGPGSAINYAAAQFDSNLYDGTRNVIDVSGDGTENSGASTAVASAAFCAKGSNYAINGVTIGGGASLKTWYENNVQCGTDSFTVAATGFDTFGAAVQNKLQREIIGDVPVPASALLLLSGVAGIGALRRKRRNA